jgi:predicted  nucleic acid-binding Zn-ribbon protein
MGNSLYTLKCIKCGVVFSDSDIEVMEVTDILMCDLCAVQMMDNKDVKGH